MEVVMDQYGSPQYGLWSGYAKPALDRLDKWAFQPGGISDFARAANFYARHSGVEYTPQMAYHGINTASDITTAGMAGGAKIGGSTLGSIIRPGKKQVEAALMTLRKYRIKGTSNLGKLMNRTKQRMSDIHPDKMVGSKAKFKEYSERGFPELSNARDILRNADPDILRKYGIF
jgi:hypothetical protein